MWQSVSVWRITGLDLTVQQCLSLTTPAWPVIRPQVCVRYALWRGWFSTGSPFPARFFCQVNQLFVPKTLTILFLLYFILSWFDSSNIFRRNRGFFVYMLPCFFYPLSYTAEFSASWQHWFLALCQPRISHAKPPLCCPFLKYLHNCNSSGNIKCDTMQ
jgi:hypothetical protein